MESGAFDPLSWIPSDFLSASFRSGELSFNGATVRDKRRETREAGRMYKLSVTPGNRIVVRGNFAHLAFSS